MRTSQQFRPHYASPLGVAPEQRDLILRAIYDIADGQALQPATVAEVAQYIAVPPGLVWKSLNGFGGLASSPIRRTLCT